MQGHGRETRIALGNVLAQMRDSDFAEGFESWQARHEIQVVRLGFQRVEKALAKK